MIEVFDLSADDKANLALILSVVSPLLTVLFSVLKGQRKSELFANNVVTRVEAGSFDGQETHYIVNPRYIRRHGDTLVVPGVGPCSITADLLRNCRESGLWLDFTDLSAMDSDAMNLVLCGRVPKP